MLIAAIVSLSAFLGLSLWSNYLYAQRTKKIEDYNTKMQATSWDQAKLIKDQKDTIKSLQFDKDAADLILVEVMAEIPEGHFFEFSHLENSKKARKDFAASAIRAIEQPDPPGKKGNGEAHFKSKEPID